MIKLNLIKKHNDTLKLKRQLKQKEEDNKTLKSKFEIYNSKITKIGAKIKSLESENLELKRKNNKLQAELEQCKEQIDAIPKFLLKLFSIKK